MRMSISTDATWLTASTAFKISAMDTAEGQRLRLIYLVTAAVGVETLTAPVLVLFYTDYVGYSFSIYSYAMAMILAFAWVLQIPCGALADRIGREPCLVTGNLLYAAALLSLLLWKSDVPAVCVALLFALGLSLSGNTLQSLIYEYHAQRHAQGDFHALMAKGTSISLFVGAMAAVAGGHLAKVSLALPMIVDWCLLILLSGMQLLLIEEDRSATSERKHQTTYADLLASGLLLVKRDRSLVTLILLAAVLLAVLRTGFNFYQPMLISSGVLNRPAF